MKILLSKELEQLIQDKVKSGRYLSASEVVGEALRLLDERDSLRDSFRTSFATASRNASRIQEARLAELKAKIREGIEASERGEVIDGEEFFAELEEDIRRIEAEMEQSVTPAVNANTRQGRGWPAGFFEETFGALKDDPLVIDSEGIFEDEEEFN